ncbi:carboxylate-amine ligase [Catenuloplanes nepalensis]|uniref:Putative glutamate--cysteine ligase 2 n=1 Tax=Catenuloplanes nepalensis TaxID=587533 RepID=A0ABT9N1E9_9ACTN|nr:glutamate--cysteine ligase [Catenuloplanes nepalensis]MDP9797528.1 carboxylate-amine ligase [Catenuloplanes nepalensis]
MSVTPTTTAPISTAPAGVLALGVEEEFLLLDAERPEPAPVVDAVLDRVSPALRASVRHAYLRTQIGVAAPPVAGLDALWRSMSLLREGVADAAEAAGARLVAIGAGPLTGPDAPVADLPRYHRTAERFGPLAPGHGLNGMHVHVGVGDPELAVQVLNHVRPWLPVLHAVTANSPFYQGVDTGYASWRSIMWERWPSVGPTPHLESYAHYRHLLDDLIASGAVLDDSMLHWHARLSATGPAVEIRAGDVCPSLEDTMLVAALIRALVATAITDVGAGLPAPAMNQQLLAAAHWRAAHDGLEGVAVDLVNQRPRPAWHLLRRLFDLVRPQLERHGDLEIATVLMSRLRSHGSGAARQRAAFARHATLDGVLTSLTEATRG